MVIIHIAIVWLQIKRETIKETQTRYRYLLHSAEYSSVAATIPNHVDSSRNHLASLLESGNQLEILESRFTITIRLFLA